MTAERPRRPDALVVTGTSLAPGLAVGTAVFHDEGEVDIPVLAIAPDDVKAEQRRLATAIRAAKTQLAEVEHSIEKEVGRRDARIFSVQALLLDDPSLRKAIRGRIEEDLVCAEVAVHDAVAAWSERFAAMRTVAGERDPVADLRDVGRRLLRILAGRPSKASKAVAETAQDGRRVVLVTHELLPSDTANIDRRHLAAIVTQSGGIASHAAILARGLGVPAITDVDVDSLPARGGSWIVDGTTGRLTLNPTDAEVAQAEVESRRFQDVREALMAESRGFARTADDVAVELSLNVENFGELPQHLLEGLRGVGLFRTEFLFMARSVFPSEEEQYRHYSEALEAGGGCEISFRTIDVGGDKPLAALSVPPEPNPVLGWRGVRLSLQWPDLFYTQLRALLRASAHGPMRIMVPMVTMLEEFEQVRAIVDEIKVDLAGREVPFDAEVPLGAMIEVPAAALAARDIAGVADFLSVGTNDLSQYALAVDRNNSRVANLYQPLHPGLIRLLRSVIEDAASRGTPVSVCGEMAGDPDAALLLLGLGLRSFSVSPFHLPMVRRLLAATTLDRAQAVAKEVLELTRVEEICAALRRHTLELAPELGRLLKPVP